MRTVEERVTNLEEILAEFISQTNESIRATNATVNRLSLEVQELKNEMKDFKDEMRAFKDEMLEFKDEMRAFKDEMLEFKDEMRAFKDEMLRFREESEKDRRQMNKQWGELANKMGTLAEDIVFPAVGPVLEKYFDCTISEKFLRYERKTKDRKKRIEVDIIAISDDKVFMIEVRSKTISLYVNEVLEKTKSFREFFPEYNDKELIPILASLVFQDDVINYANKKGLFLMAFREWEYMDIVNFDKVKKKGMAK